MAKTMFVPISIKLSGDASTFGFVFKSGAHLFNKNGAISLVSTLMSEADATIEDVDLKMALFPHPYGKLVDIKEYAIADNKDDFWHLPFKGSSGRISRKLQGCLIQSGTDVLLCLEVEIYGRSQAEDPQADADVALPTSRPFIIVNQQFKEATQLMIGTTRWNALITLAVVLTTGRVIVGPNNPSFKPHRNSSLWLKIDGEKDNHNNLFRHTRTNFDNIVTFGAHAAIDPRFNRSQTRPATLSDLWSFKAGKNGWTGVKLAAYIFYILYDAAEPLMKTKF
ncbi:hypothetical protein BGZ94_009187 [Podila epigama]|nr:hypothetical protein BGZ94_009187 [Podila epigama]